MSFTTGLGMPTMLGRTEYYINSQNTGTPINQWSANTYLMLSFDKSGSMNDVIPAVTAVVDCDYCGSGSAAGGDCVKAVNCLRADLQDYYATGATEEAGNANAATNGKDAYEAHVAYRALGNEQFITFFENYYPARSLDADTTAFANHTTWEAFGDANTVDNIVFLTVANEAKPGSPLHHDTKYHRSLFGGPFTAEVTAVVDGATSSSTTFTSVDEYGDGTGGTVGDKLTHIGAAGYSGNNSFRMKLTARSSGGTITGTPHITNTSGNDVTLSAAHSFLDEEVLTFQVTNAGIDMSVNDMPNYKSDIKILRESVQLGDVDYTSGLHGFTYAPGKGLSGIKESSGQEPSLHWIHIDPGGDGNGERVTGGTSAAHPRGPVGDNSNSPGALYTGPQLHLIEGLTQGLGPYDETSIGGLNYSVNDWNTMISAWNNKSNTFTPITFYEQSGNSSQAFWYNEMKLAIGIGMNL
tara:strand:- start:4 stop:1404 length:1401 start_codon:yes stop_codon:yes gene_type:complete